MPASVQLLATSDNQQIDEIATGMIGLFEQAFPGRISGYYFAGSCADGATTPLSDIDMTVVFARSITAAEQQQWNTLVGACKRISPRNLDISLVEEAQLLHADQLGFSPDWRPLLSAVTLKHASLLIFGTDIRAAVPAVPHATYARTMIHFPYLVLAGQRQHPEHMPFPLDPPDPRDTFFGYTGRQLRAPDGTLTPSTKRLVHASGYIATALLAMNTTALIANKRVAMSAYRQQINDGWAEHLETVNKHCRVAWGYRVPGAAEDQQVLRALCQQELAFENYFWALYGAFVLREIHAADEAARQMAQERVARLMIA